MTLCFAAGLVGVAQSSTAPSGDELDAAFKLATGSRQAAAAAPALVACTCWASVRARSGCCGTSALAPASTRREEWGKALGLVLPLFWVVRHAANQERAWIRDLPAPEVEAGAVDPPLLDAPAASA